MKTPAEKIAWQRQAYGCTEEMLDEQIENSISGPHMVAMSMLSDAQHCIEHGLTENARQLINQAKHVMISRLIENEAVITALISKEDLPF